VTSLRSLLVSDTASGMPWPSVRTWCLLPVRHAPAPGAGAVLRRGPLVNVGSAAGLDVVGLTTVAPRWCGAPPAGPGGFIAQLRAHGGEAAVTAEPVEGELHVAFGEPVWGVAPGQAIVL